MKIDVGDGADYGKPEAGPGGNGFQAAPGQRPGQGPTAGVPNTGGLVVDNDPVGTALERQRLAVYLGEKHDATGCVRIGQDENGPPGDLAVYQSASCLESGYATCMPSTSRARAKSSGRSRSSSLSALTGNAKPPEFTRSS